MLIVHVFVHVHPHRVDAFIAAMAEPRRSVKYHALIPDAAAEWERPR